MAVKEEEQRPCGSCNKLVITMEGGRPVHRHGGWLEFKCLECGWLGGKCGGTTQCLSCSSTNIIIDHNAI